MLFFVWQEERSGPVPRDGAAAADKSGRDGSGRRPRPPGGNVQTYRQKKGRRNLPTVPHETVAVLFCWFRRLAVVGPGRRGAALAAVFGDSCLCNPKRLPPRARARKQRAGAGWPPGARHDQPPGQPSTVAFRAAFVKDGRRQPGSALDRGPPHWAGRPGLRAPCEAQRHVAIVCTKASCDGESQQAR